MGSAKFAAYLLSGMTACIVAANCSADQSNFYVGGNFGQSVAKLDNVTNSQNSGLTNSGFAVTGNDLNDTDTAFRAFVGYKFNDYFAVEGGYINFGKFSTSANTNPAGSANTELKASGISLDALGMLPLGETGFSIFGRLGATRAELKETLSSSGAVAYVPGTNLNPTATKTVYDYGYGLQYDYNKLVAFRGEWQVYKKLGDQNSTGEVDMHFLSMGVLFKF